jgi:hypothetical protein
VLPPEGGGSVEPTVTALDRQSRQPDECAVVQHAAGFEDALGGALHAGVEWLWLLDGSVVPEPHALESLLGALDRVDLIAAPVILASKVVMPDGALDPRSLPVPHVHEPDRVVAAFEQRLLAVRLVRRGSVLVHRRGIEREGLPRTGSVFFGDDLVWTGRLLRDEPGLLVPASVVVRRPPSERSVKRGKRTSVAAGLRLLTSDALAPGEKPWFGGRLGEEMLGMLRGSLAGLRRT